MTGAGCCLSASRASVRRGRQKVRQMLDSPSAPERKDTSGLQFRRWSEVCSSTFLRADRIRATRSDAARCRRLAPVRYPGGTRVRPHLASVLCTRQCSVETPYGRCRPHRRAPPSCAQTAGETPSQRSLCGRSFTSVGSAFGNATRSSSMAAGGRSRTPCSLASRSPCSSTAASGIGALSTGQARQGTRPTGVPSSTATPLVTATRTASSRSAGGRSCARGNTRTLRKSPSE